jgi:CheY-like chemotaxis protein
VDGFAGAAREDHRGPCFPPFENRENPAVSAVEGAGRARPCKISTRGATSLSALSKHPDGSLHRFKIMSVDGFVKVVETITHLLGVVLWPLIFIFMLVRFRSAIADFISTVGEFSFKAAGIEATAKVRAQAAVSLAAATARAREQAAAGGAAEAAKRAVQAAAGLAAAGASRPESATSPQATLQEARVAAQVVTDAITPRVIRRAERSTVLWVDDRPDNNVHERQALEAVGISFVLSTSTEDALDQIGRQTFDLIISDMGRPPDPRAGYTLLDKLRASGNRTPFIIYAGSRSSEHQQEAKQHGAIGCTNRPNELFEMVLSALGRGPQ